jgi:hypothetical protein
MLPKSPSKLTGLYLRHTAEEQLELEDEQADGRDRTDDVGVEEAPWAVGSAPPTCSCKVKEKGKSELFCCLVERARQ